MQLLHALLAASLSRSLKSESPLADRLDISTSDDNGKETNHLEAVVSAWLQATASVKPAAKPALLPTPWWDWTAPEGHLRPLLPKPGTVSHHPWSGCPTQATASPSVCYPSTTFLAALLREPDSDEFKPERWSSGGPLVVEIGPFLGESTVGLAESLLALPAVQVVSMDTWHEHYGFTGIMMHETAWELPSEAVSAVVQHEEWLTAGQTLLFEQWARDVNATSANNIYHRTDLAERVIPFPLVPAKEAVEHAKLLGASGVRPRLVYINPPRRAEKMRLDLREGWRLLACGGSMAGAGFHLPSVHDEVVAFEALTGGVPLVAHTVHAPGASKFENISHPYTDDGMLANTRSNFSTWEFRGKRC